MILNYNEYVKYQASYGLNSPKENNRELYFEKRGFCPFCKLDTCLVHNNSIVDVKTLKGAGWHKVEKVWSCPICGWWEYSMDSYIDGEKTWSMKDWELIINSATLKQFDIGSKEVPIELLRTYIQKNKDAIYGIHNKKMEELVGSIFKEHFNCEVHHVGKSSDGGIDLILIESDKSTIVQIKRRMSSGKTESVKEIRDLIGASVLTDSRNCIFVTTADHFSKAAVEARNTILTKPMIDSFELYDFSKFAHLLDLYKKDKVNEWDRMIKLK